jgi:hypothetical protein
MIHVNACSMDSGTDYSYLYPRCVQELSEAVLLHAVAEVRQALQLLERHRSPAGRELRLHLSQAAHSLETELQRRGAN